MIRSYKNLNRSERNLMLFVISFTLSNLLSGIIYDTYINYMQEIASTIALSFWSYYGYATFISAIMIIAVNKIGYKKLLLFSPVSVLLALLAAVVVKNTYIYKLTTILSLVGLQLHYSLLAPYLSLYTRDDNRAKWYSRAYWIGYSGWVLTTYLGGYYTVYRFSKHQNSSYKFAKILTENLEVLDNFSRQNYILANKDVLIISAIVAALSIIPILLIKEKRSDYSNRNSDTPYINKNVIKDLIGDFKFFIRDKYVLSFIVYFSLINFAMGLFTPYFTIYLNRVLNIDRASSSLLVSISYSAMIIFTMITPKLVELFGEVKTLVLSLLLSIPFMLIIAKGNSLGSYKLVIIGIALFMRSGLANLSGPIESSLSMSLVKKTQVANFSTILNIIIGLVSIGAGYFTGNFLFTKISGYVYGYYIASFIYSLAAINILLVFRRKR